MREKKLSLGNVICYIILILWGIITIYPLIYTFISSFKTETDMFSNLFGLPKEYIFSNYSHLFTEMNLMRNIMNSLFLAIMTVTLQLIFGAMASYIIANFSMKINNKIMLYFIIGMLIPVHAIIIPISIIAKAVNGYNSFWFIIAIYVATGLPYLIFVVTGFMRSIPKELVEAAIVDGCNANQAFWKIVLPLSKPVLATMGMLSFIGAWNELILALVLLKNNATKTVSLALTLFAGERFSNYPGMCAAVIVGVLPTMIIYFMFQENIIKGMTAGSVKG
ncbi:hypothetical protein CS063_12595 [Sporanaerobium hydrogeniformans]|uniref:Uncharacterized protein n=1 Tax=Sporanaerobium hydrogeniformans TaxID=3072179 RepID=A0AC61DAT3_9FIRM|nr:carbohydrate ABC transporter permease [Sporanaerobium hydrogeniformans]PHV69980.1 hypothetical protein CS063_12595 [Sporanaerobium hydrogeniformans]